LNVELDLDLDLGLGLGLWYLKMRVDFFNLSLGLGFVGVREVLGLGHGSGSGYEGGIEGNTNGKQTPIWEAEWDAAWKWEGRGREQRFVEDGKEELERKWGSDVCFMLFPLFYVFFYVLGFCFIVHHLATLF